jgi:alginate O-acetyltransferase complex protein AlgI
VYIPLGGNRRAQVRNILIVWFLTGLWHGASWNFIGWGLYYGILLMIEKLLSGASFRLPGFFAWLVTMLIVLYGWGIFYFTDTGRLIRFSLVFFLVNAAFGLSDLKAASVFFQYFWLLLVCFVASTPLLRNLFRRYVASRRALDLPWSLGVAALLALCFLLLVGESYNPFLYFRF